MTVGIVESLALAAAVIVIGIILSGSISLVVAVRGARRKWSRILSTLLVAPSLVGGAWLAALTVGVGARLIGSVVLGTGVAALVRLWARP